MFKNKLKKHGFTVIELIVIMAVMAILVFLGALGYKGYTRQAQMTRLQYDSRLLSDACQRFYVDNGDYPRKVDTPYTADQVNDFSQKIYDGKGSVVTIDSSGSYYDIDFTKLKKYVTVKEDYLNFVLQNPVGDVYFLEPTSNRRLLENAAKVPTAATISVNTSTNPPTFSISYPNNITPQEVEYKLDNSTVTTTAPSSVLPLGSHTISIRYKHSGFYSDWVSADFSYAQPAAPTVTISGTTTPSFSIAYPGGITPQVTEYQLDGGVITTSAPTNVTAGTHTVKVRYQYNSFYSDWTTKTFDVASLLPGPSTIITGNSTAGYYGKATGIITGLDLSLNTGVTMGTPVNNLDITWLKFSSNGKTLYVADRPIRQCISWDFINSKGCVMGKTISINGVNYKVRLLTGGEKSSGYGALPTTNEWDSLIVPFTPSDADSNWSSISSWCQETWWMDSYSRTTRGYGSVVYNISHDSLASASYQDGWRPVLEVIP